MCSSEPDEALDDLGLAERPAEVGEELALESDGDALAVDEHTVTVNDHEVETSHRCSLRSAPLGPGTSARGLGSTRGGHDGQ